MDDTSDITVQTVHVDNSIDNQTGQNGRDSCKITREEDAYKWSLPDNLALYEFIPDKELREQILLELPRPSNLDPVKNLNESLVNIMKKDHHQRLDIIKNIEKDSGKGW